jgi:hypothetical protein
MTFRDQLVLSVVDKALIGLIIAFAGFWLNRYLEAFKSRRALENEMLRARDQKRLELLQSQLSQFYWPLFLRMQMDNVIWEKILERQSTDPVIANLAHHVESDFILPNHLEARQIISSNIHLAAPDSSLMIAILKYLRHITIYQALRAGGNISVDPLHVHEPWPGELFPLLESATRARQQEFEELLHSQFAK